jgi:hypothetical protein
VPLGFRATLRRVARRRRRSCGVADGVVHDSRAALDGVERVSGGKFCRSTRFLVAIATPRPYIESVCIRGGDFRREIAAHDGAAGDVR